MNFHILSYHLPDNPREALDLQRRVFEKCGLSIEQVCLPLPWPASLNTVDRWLHETSRDNPEDGLIVCHSDVIPLHRFAIQDVYFPAIRAGLLIDFVCRPISDAIYRGATFHAAGALMGLSAATFRRLGAPSLRENEAEPPCWDVAGLFSRRAAERGVETILLPPSQCAQPAVWRLYDERLEWGPGSIYAGLFYHALEFRFHPQRFIAKAKEVLAAL